MIEFCKILSISKLDAQIVLAALDSAEAPFEDVAGEIYDRRVKELKAQIYKQFPEFAPPKASDANYPDDEFGWDE